MNKDITRKYKVEKLANMDLVFRNVFSCYRECEFRAREDADFNGRDSLHDSRQVSFYPIQFASSHVAFYKAEFTGV